MAASPPGRAGRGRLVAILALAAAGLGLLATGGYALFHELTRAPTKAELAKASDAEMAQRWQQYTAGQIFPATLSYPMPIGTVNAKARLVGIAPQASCLAASVPAVARALNARGCRALLRATYTDQSGTLLATIAVAVMPGRSAAAAAVDGLGMTGSGIHPVGFSGTVASGFNVSSVHSFNFSVAGPYIVLEATGYADHRPVVSIDPTLSAPVDPLSFAANLADDVVGTLTRPVPPCKAVDVRC